MKVNRFSEHKAFPIVVLTVLTIIWGSSFILMKKGLVVFNPVQVGTLRMFFASLVLIPLVILHFRKYFLGRWKKFLVVGLVGNFIPAILFAYAETGISSALAGILNALTPIFTLLIGALFFATRFHKWQTAGLILGFGGSVALSFIGQDGGLGGFNHYAATIIIATVCYGININLLKKWFPELKSTILTAFTMFAVGPLAVVYLFCSDVISVIVHTDGAFLALFYLFLLGAVGTAFAFVLFNKLIQISTAVFASTVTYLIPIMAVIWGLLDNEALYPIHFGGMAMIILGVYIINKNK